MYHGSIDLRESYGEQKLRMEPSGYGRVMHNLPRTEGLLQPSGIGILTSKLAGAPFHSLCRKRATGFHCLWSILHNFWYHLRRLLFIPTPSEVAKSLNRPRASLSFLVFLLFFICFSFFPYYIATFLYGVWGGNFDRWNTEDEEK